MTDTAQAARPDRRAAAKVGALPENAVVADVSHRMPLMIAIMAGVCLHTIDSTIANVVLPHMQGTLSASLDQVSWVITSYIVAAAIGTPLVSWLVAKYGIKRVFIVSTLGFTASSVLCGLALSLSDMIAYRLLQGFSGAALMPLAQATIMGLYTRKDYPKAMAIFGVGVMMGPVIGPTLGGYITDFASWRWCFFINVPVGIAAALGVFFLMHEPDTREEKPHLDVIGFIGLTVAIGAAQMMLDRGDSKDWFQSTEITIYAAMAAIGLYVFVVQMLTAERPFFDRALFRDRNFVIGNALFFLVMGNMVGAVVLQPPMLQSLMGHPATSVGLLLVPRGIGTAIGMKFCGSMQSRIDPRILVFAGLSLVAWGMWDFAHFNLMVTERDVIRAGFIHGLGLGLTFVPLSTLSFGTIPDRLRIQATIGFNIMRTFGSSAMVAVCISLLTTSTAINRGELVTHINPYNEQFALNGLAPLSATSSPVALAVADLEVTRQASMIAFANDFYFLFWSALFCMIMIVFIRPVTVPEGKLEELKEDVMHA